MSGSVVDPAVLADAVAGTDMIFEAVAPRGDMAGKLEAVITESMAAAADAGVRLDVMGAGRLCWCRQAAPLP